MKKQVPFKKDIKFDNNIAQLNSISLEYEISEKNDNVIAGIFIISGDYKMVNDSENIDNFEYKLPFNINIDKKYDINESNIEISDFYYEVINNQTLSVNIELEVDNIKEREVVMERQDTQIEKPEQIIEIDEQDTSSLFDNIEENETYSTYKIHIMTENDTIESIMMEYSVSKDDLLDYNDLNEIKIGDKIIVPSNES